MQCKSMTKQGKRCKNSAMEGAEYCGVHAHLAGATPRSRPASQDRQAAGHAPARFADDGVANNAPPQDDPLRVVAEAMFRAAENADLAEATPGERGRTGGAFSQALYSTSYCIGYGVAFPSCLVLELLPKAGPVARGLRDGAQAAREVFDGRQGRRNGQVGVEDDAGSV